MHSRGAASGVLVEGWRALELALLNSAAGALQATVLQHATTQAGTRVAPNSLSASALTRIRHSANSSDACDTPPIVGISNAEPVYDPTTDDQGCFIEAEDENNCYVRFPSKSHQAGVTVSHFFFCPCTGVRNRYCHQHVSATWTRLGSEVDCEYVR